MPAITFLLLLAQGLIQYPQQAGDGLDEATVERMQQRAEYLNQQMVQLIEEMEQTELEQSDGAWGALPVWQFWALTGILLLLLVLWFGPKKIRCDPDNSGHKEMSSSNSVEEEEEEEEEENIVAKKDTESNDANVEEEEEEENIVAKKDTESNDANVEEEEGQNIVAKKDTESKDANVEEEEGQNIVAKKDTESKDANVEEDNKDGKEEGSNVDPKAESSVGNEAKEGCDDAKEEVNNDEKGEEVSAARNEEDKCSENKEDDEHDVKRNPGSLSEVHIPLPVLDLDRGCLVIMDLMDKLTQIFGQRLSNSSYPVPQQAIGVDSAFEGWSPRAQDVEYRVLVPLSPPPGHAFHLELDTAAMVQRNFCVRVELLCTCRREQMGEDMLCFLHHPEEELRRKQDPSLLHTLCTGSYLDVEKTVHWFHRFVKAAWMLLPQSRHWRLMLQRLSRSCKFQLSNDKESFTIKVIFGVQQGDSDVFVGSQPTEVDIPSTTWLETYAVAEAKFFRLISRQAPHDSWHCKYLQLLTSMLMGVGFSSYALKTVVMHLLNTIPLTQWRRRDFQHRIMDILKYLHCSLETKQLNHFVIGNERLPMEIRLPSDFRAAEPPNLFQDLAGNPEAHKKAEQAYFHLLQRLIKTIERGAPAQS